MGKSKTAAGTSTATDEAGLMKKLDGDWQRSSVKKTEFELLRAQGLLPPSDQVQVRAPGKEVYPTPREGERVCFVDFLPRGFGFPLHDFVHGLLYAYGVQIHDLTPNGVLSIASFIVLCECFLGIAPHWALWKSLFLVRKNVGKSGLTYPVGGFGIQVRGDTTYFQMKKSDSVQGCGGDGSTSSGTRRACPSLRASAGCGRPASGRTRSPRKRRNRRGR